MPDAYVDTSCLLAIAFAEKGAQSARRRMDAFDRLVASNLLEAELRSVYRREGLGGDPDFLTAITWVVPERILSAELAQVFAAGLVRGANAWHLATAIYFRTRIGPLAFLTLDTRQARVAAALGFET